MTSQLGTSTFVNPSIHRFNLLQLINPSQNEELGEPSCPSASHGGQEAISPVRRESPPSCWGDMVPVHQLHHHSHRGAISIASSQLTFEMPASRAAIPIANDGVFRRHERLFTVRDVP
jgi:hypothetical protein